MPVAPPASAAALVHSSRGRLSPRSAQPAVTNAAAMSTLTYLVTATSVTSPAEREPLAADQVLTIAQEDAIQACRDLSGYRVCLALEEDGWHIDYELKDPKLKGGGPHYVVDAFNGVIVTKRYEQ